MNWLASLAISWVALAAQPAGSQPAGDSPLASELVPLPPPLPPLPPNPVETLRQLLAKTPAERESALAQKPEKQREYLRRRLRDFDALDPVEREAKLRLLQLRFYLIPLIKTPPSNRTEVLQRLPPADRRLVQERLREWDALPPDRQKQLLANEATLRFFPRFAAPTEVASDTVTRDFSLEERQKLEEELLRWRETPAERQARTYQHFRRFFELSDQEKVKALRSLPSSDRQRVERAVQTFGKLPPEQQAKCLEAFQRFANMTPEERNKFLDNAARWDAMTPEERRAWRELVAQSPPSPPGMGFELPMPPALPSAPASAQPPSKAVVSTNAPGR